jgi:hypothetical protein
MFRCPKITLKGLPSTAVVEKIRVDLLIGLAQVARHLDAQIILVT